MTVSLHFIFYLILFWCQQNRWGVYG
jgi:hypothetical protein